MTTPTDTPPPTDTDALAARLREAAERATPGEWHSGHSTIIPTADILYVAAEIGEFAVFVFDKPGLRSVNRREQYLSEEADAAYIAAANPSAVLALLAERERLRARAAEAERERTHLSAMAHHLEAFLRGIVSHWDEFGHEYGLDELMSHARSFLHHAPGVGLAACPLCGDAMPCGCDGKRKSQ